MCFFKILFRCLYIAVCIRGMDTHTRGGGGGCSLSGYIYSPYPVPRLPYLDTSAQPHPAVVSTLCKDHLVTPTFGTESFTFTKLIHP